MKFVGRSFELQKLQEIKKSKRSELVIIYGRRRVGKSALLDQITQDAEDYSFEAVKGLSKQKQISHFLKQLSEKTHVKTKPATSWESAFDQLTPHISTGFHTVIFDEFPWMASERTELVAILKYYWDRKWKQNTGLKLILCGSIANFMLKHLVHSEALHNRKTLEMKIDPLPAFEAKDFFSDKRSYFEIAKFLMVFGGVPKYLEQISPNFSFEQNLDQLCFTKNAFFTNEFETVFNEQFKSVKNYEPIIQALSSGKKTKERLQTLTKNVRGGGFGTFLSQLEIAGFINREISLSLDEKGRKTRTQKFGIWDEWLKFYLTYVKKNQNLIQNQTSLGLSGRLLSNSIYTYLGLSFEIFCRKNISQILKALKIDPASIVDFGPYFRQSPKNQKKTSESVQIDIMIIRKGNLITLIECKFRENPVDVSIIAEIKNKIDRLNLPKRLSMEKVLISASGVTPELENRNYFHQILGLEAIFEHQRG